MKPMTTDLDPPRRVITDVYFVGGNTIKCVGTWSKCLEIRVEPNLDKKTSCVDTATFFSDLEQKITGSQQDRQLAKSQSTIDQVSTLSATIDGIEKCR